MVENAKHPGWPSLPKPGEIVVCVLACIGGALVFGLLAYISVEFTRADSRIAAIWIPNAIAVACLLRFRIAYEQLFILALWIGNSSANVIGGDPVWSGAALAACNAIEIQIAVALARRWCGKQPNMQDIEELVRFLAAAAVVAPMVAATLATFTLDATGSAILPTWAKWAATDGLGMAIVAPGLMVLIDAARRPLALSSARMAEWCSVVLGGAAVTVALFYQDTLPLLFITAPVILLHAFLLGAPGTAIGMAITAAISIAMTSTGHGPVNLVESDLTTKLIVLQTYLASAFLMGLPIAAMLAGRDRAMAQLASKQRELALLADNITDAVLHYDMSGVCTYASRSVQNVLGEPPEAFLGQPGSARAHPDSQSHFAEIEQRLLSGVCAKERFIFRRRADDEAGHPIYIEADCAVAREKPGGPPSGMVVSARDVTDRVELNMQLNRARRVAEEAARGKSEFLANMSHEIRTPMNGVLGFAELLAQADLPSEQKRHAELIVQSGRSMMMLLNDILDLAKIEAGHVSIEREPTDLGELIRDCTRLHQASAEKKGLKLTCEGPKRGPFIITDGLRLRQILLNLLSNAVKFTEEGSIILRHSIRDDRVHIEIEDTGIGILADRLANIFDPFVQGESDTSRRYGGTGLGLTISRQLAELLDGYLDVTSTPGKGSCFTLSIPYEATVDAPEKVRERVRSEEGDPQLQPSRILLAEDHDINRMLVTAMLERCGQLVTVARDGEEAIEAVLEAYAEGTPFDLVLMDIQMPGCDGYSATRAIRGEGIRASNLPIIALTANAFPEDIAAAREAGMQGHLAKPLAFADLVNALQRWLPVRIVDAAVGPSRTAAQAEPAKNPATVHSPSLVKRWQVRRSETIAAVSAALHDEALGGAEADALARLVHTLAGTAGMFGEAKLGECAAALEKALRTDSAIQDRRALAQQLLDTAMFHDQPKQPESE